MEAMAAESLVATAWELEGFLTKVRWPIRVDGGYSDVDVIGVNAAPVARLAECKVRGPARAVYVVDADFESWLGDWAKCIENMERLWAQRPDWLPTPNATSRVEMWFCGNVWFRDQETMATAEARFSELVRARCPRGLEHKAVGRIVSTRDLLVSVVSGVRNRVVEDGHGKRFGNPLLDAMRELIRYTSPQPHGGGRVGEKISHETRTQVLGALGLLPDDEAVQH